MSKSQKINKTTEAKKQKEHHQSEIIHHKMMEHYWGCTECQRLAAKFRLCPEGEGLYTATKNFEGLEK